MAESYNSGYGPSDYKSIVPIKVSITEASVAHERYYLMLEYFWNGPKSLSTLPNDSRWFLVPITVLR